METPLIVRIQCSVLEVVLFEKDMTLYIKFAEQVHPAILNVSAGRTHSNPTSSPQGLSVAESYKTSQFLQP